MLLFSRDIDDDYLHQDPLGSMDFHDYQRKVILDVEWVGEGNYRRWMQDRFEIAFKYLVRKSLSIRRKRNGVPIFLSDSAARK